MSRQLRRLSFLRGNCPPAERVGKLFTVSGRVGCLPATEGLRVSIEPKFLPRFCILAIGKEGHEHIARFIVGGSTDRICYKRLIVVVCDQSRHSVWRRTL